ncbi:hypothetical protein [Quadrisphaera sp. DSM 44207]|uniref:hypothetical protein n=1 Tax=Quadrisphaera sp. DSM 44207 TaxID=1881057 RepID=UPI000889CA5A|nr:hypothetical protein [Quadrisphaera sp. DSM 44207]SDQ41915.1 hypothetical protein SAMN05428996_1630 [Quadrisphaera sp. DSM 44207]
MDERTPARRASRLALAAAVLLLAAAASGCTVTDPQLTTVSYCPGDASCADLGRGVQADSLVVVAEAPGAPGALVARLVNTSLQERHIRVTAEGLEEVFEVGPRQTLALGGVSPAPSRWSSPPCPSNRVS